MNDKIKDLEERIKKLEEIVADYLASADSDDELFPKAVEIIKEYEEVSPSLLQRKLNIGYARAAKILDQLTKEGYISPGNGADPRQVLKK